MKHIADGECFAVLRNVAPKPVRHEAVVALCENGVLLTVHGDVNEAMYNHLGEKVVEYRRIVWNSDGSPVEGEITLEKALVSYRHEYDALKAERDEWKPKAEEALRLLVETNTRREQDIALIERLESDLAQLERNEHSIVREIARQREANAEQVKRMQEHNDGWKHEYDRMKPVVDAAISFEKMDGGSLPASIDRVLSAVRSYHQGEPEKSCETCGNFSSGVACIPGNGMVCVHSLHAEPGSTDKWEARR